MFTVSGPLGKITRSFRHTHFKVEKLNNIIRISLFQGDKRQMATIRTIASHISNMIKGVTKGVLYKLRAVYAHFPINVSVLDNGTAVEVRNFLGQKFVRRINMMDGVKFEVSASQKDEYLISGIELEKVAQSSALVHQSMLVRGKDTRTFLDGMYVSEKTSIQDE